MRLSEVRVKGLFSQFDYTIKLNPTERLTIIHAPNGFGKTTVLKLVHAVLNQEVQALFEVPFKQLELTFDDDDRLLIELKGEKLALSRCTLGQKKVRTAEIKHQDVPFDMDPGSRYESMRRADAALRRAITYQAPLEELQRIKQLRNRLAHAADPQNMPYDTSLLEFPGYTTHLIGSERIFRDPSPSNDPDPERNRRSRSICEYAKHLSSRLKRIVEGYAKQAQQLDQTFPLRLINRIDGESTQTQRELNLDESLQEVSGKRQRLKDVGLLVKADDAFTLPTNLQDTMRSVLSLYFDDIKVKRKRGFLAV